MKAFAYVSLLLGMVAQVSSLTEDQIAGIITDLYAEKSYLDSATLSIAGTYQTKALQATKNNLKDVPNKEAKHVKNYFAAATIFYATNGQASTRTALDLGADFVPPSWYRTDNWIQDPDYCNWYGVTCFLDILDEEAQVAQIAEEEIIEIQLFNNTLYGVWPNEVGLLGEKLVTIDLYDNFYHSAVDYSWFADMDAMEYLFFGSTSWEAYGIPNELSELTKLKQFDCSYTYWSEGPIDPASFNGLADLEYVDAGDNIYNYEAGVGAMDAFKIDVLPSLIRLYFDNVRFIDEDREDVTFSMDFLTSLTSVIEAWFDFTKFTGGLPTLPSTLRSFSVIYCGLVGDINSLTTTSANLDRVWLTGNSFTGDIPAALATKHSDLTRIYFEFNDFTTGTIPAEFCGIGSLIALGGDEDQCPQDGCCTCIGMACDNTPDPTPAPEGEVTPPPFGICFSGSSMVEVENKGSVKMADLALGDNVQVGNNKFEPIYSFGHKDSTSSAEFLRITTEGSSAPLEISPDHMVAIEGGRHVPASLVKTGDMLLTVSDGVAAVTNVKNVVRKGVFAPFTASGSIVVNGIVASNYIAYQGSEYLKVGEIETPLSYQWVAHTFNSVHRLAVMAGFTGETYSEGEEGISHWVAMPHKMFSWVVDQNIVVSASLIGLALPLFSLAWLIELLVSNPAALAIVVGGASLMTLKKSAKKVL